jgi:TonB family protein
VSLEVEVQMTWLRVRFRRWLTLRVVILLTSLGLHGLAALALLAAGPLLAGGQAPVPGADPRVTVVADEIPPLTPLLEEEPPPAWTPDRLPEPEPVDRAEEALPEEVETAPDLDLPRLPGPPAAAGEIAIRSLRGRVPSASPGLRPQAARREGPTRPPRVLAPPRVAYTMGPADLRAPDGGALRVRVRVSPTGAVEDVVVRSRSGLVSFDETVLASVSTWRFEPAQVAGETVASEFDLDLTPARAIEMPFPDYPRRAQDRNLEGVVRCALDIGADGSVTGVRVLVSSGVGMLDDAAVEALGRWRFHPAKVNGTATRCTVEPPPIRFRLQ